MKVLIITLSVSLLLLGQVHAINSVKIYEGIQDKTLEIRNVTPSDWLDKIEKRLAKKYDFSTNIGYLYEDIDEVMEKCGIEDDFAQEFMDESISSKATTWEKIVRKKNNKSVAYLLKLFANVSFVHPVTEQTIHCTIRRGTYVIGRSGRSIDDDKLSEVHGTYFGAFL